MPAAAEDRLPPPCWLPRACLQTFPADRTQEVSREVAKPTCPNESSIDLSVQGYSGFSEDTPALILGVNHLTHVSKQDECWLEEQSNTFGVSALFKSDWQWKITAG